MAVVSLGIAVVVLSVKVSALGDGLEIVATEQSNRSKAVKAVEALEVRVAKSETVPADVLQAIEQWKKEFGDVTPADVLRKLEMIESELKRLLGTEGQYDEPTERK